MPNADPAKIQKPERLKTLHNLHLLNTPADPAFDRLTRLASMMLKMPVSLVTLVDAGRQFFKSAIGLPEPWASLRETPLKYSFCQHVVASGEPLIIENTRLHPLVKDNPAIQYLNLISYAGMPLTMSNGETLGSFCVGGLDAHVWTDEELIMLADLSRAVITELELRSELLERQHIEQELREKEMWLNAVVNGAPIILYMLDTQGNILLSQGKALEALGRQQNETVGLSAFELYANHVTVREGMQRALNGEAFSMIDEVEGHSYTISYSPMVSPIGELEGTIGVATDISALMETQRALQSSLQRVSELEELKSDMIRLAAHDLKNPLTVVLGYAELLLEDDLTEDQIDFAQAILVSARHMQRIITDILSLERIEATAKTANAHYQSIDLCEMISKAYWQCQTLSEKKHQNYQLNLLVGGVYVSGDESQLLEAATNLINNAIKYTQDGGTVMVSVQKDEQRVIFEVEDNGYGIPKEQQNSLFKPFFRVHSQETQDIEGSGLGLNLVKNIVERHRGKIRFESQYGQGSHFGFELPLRL